MQEPLYMSLCIGTTCMEAEDAAWRMAWERMARARGRGRAVHAGSAAARGRRR